MADVNPPINVQRVHPGGFFWTVERVDRLNHVVNFVAQTRRLAVVANAVSVAEEYAERLTLSGVPIYQATDINSTVSCDAFKATDGGTLVTTAEFVVAHGPLPVSMTIHLRAASSVRDYTKRLAALPASVHLTFVVPEDEKRARSLCSHFEHDHGHGRTQDVSLVDLIDLTDSNSVAMVSSARRRFPLSRNDT